MMMWPVTSLLAHLWHPKRANERQLPTNTVGRRARLDDGSGARLAASRRPEHRQLGAESGRRPHWRSHGIQNPTYAVAAVDAASRAAHAVEHRETSGQYVGQVLPIRRRLPVLAHWDERHIDPELLLQFEADPLLLLQIGRIEPLGAQFLDARTVGPAVYRLLAVGANGQIAKRMHVRQRPVNQGAEHVMATLIRRALIVAAPDDVGEINLQQIDVHPGAPQLLGAGSCQVA